MHYASIALSGGFTVETSKPTRANIKGQTAPVPYIRKCKIGKFIHSAVAQPAQNFGGPNLLNLS